MKIFKLSLALKGLAEEIMPTGGVPLLPKGRARALAIISKPLLMTSLEMK
jgi:hypothetical protein